MSAEILEFPDRRAMAAALAEQVADDLGVAIAFKGHATLAVPGGTTPGPFLTALADKELDWRSVTATLTDERWVSADHPRSNARLLQETLLTGWAAALDFVPLFIEAPTPGPVIERIGVDVAERVLPLDVCVLGMGADTHIASLFPGADRLDEALDIRCPLPVMPMQAPGAAETRITLTAPSLLSSAHIYILIAGAEKRAALGAALGEGSVTEMPVRLVLRCDRTVDVYYAP